MKSKLVAKAFALITTVCTLMALTVSASACSWNSYQPEEPKCLQK